MATRRLALNLQRGLRNKQALNAIKPVYRGFATPASPPVTTQSTTLNNGFTVSSHAVHMNAKELIGRADCDRALALVASIFFTSMSAN